MKNKIYLFKFLIIKIKKNYLNNKILINFYTFKIYQLIT